MTLQEFEYHYYVATGIGYLTLEWIESNKPSSYDEKIEYFAQLVGYIQLLKNHCFGDDDEVKKYGRFDIFGNASDLTEKLIEIIFGKTGEDINNSPNVVSGLAYEFEDFNSLTSSTNIIKEERSLYLVKTNYSKVYLGYKYEQNDNTSEAFPFDNKYTIVNTNNKYTNTSEAVDNLTVSDLDINYENYSELDILYQVNTNTYLLYKYNVLSGKWDKTTNIYNDGNEEIVLGIRYLLGEDGEYILTDDGRKIIV